MTRHLIDRAQQREVLDSLLLQRFDEPPTRSAELRLYGACHQSADVSSTA